MVRADPVHPWGLFSPAENIAHVVRFEVFKYFTFSFRASIFIILLVCR